MKKLIISLLLSSFLYSTQIFSQPVIGQVAPSATGLQIIDKQLPDLGNKFVIIDFWATWCLPCIKSMPHLNALAEKYKDKIVFLAISKEKEDKVKSFLQNKNYDNLFFGLDIQLDCHLKFAIKFIPTFYLISPENTVLSTGLSSELSESYLDSVITHYHPAKLNKPTQIVVSKDSSEKISSIEIRQMPGSKQYKTENQHSFIIRDTLRYIMPYLTGVRVANRIRWEKPFKEMIEVKIFSRNSPVDSLKKAAHDLIMASYGIHKKEVTERTRIFRVEVKNLKLLKDKNTIIDPDVRQRRDILNDSTYRFDNYTLKELVAFLESTNSCFPRIMYADSSLTEEYDWDLVIINPDARTWVSFDRLKAVLSKDYGIEFKEVENEEVYTTYY